MSIIELGAIGELVGGAAVIVTLIFIAIQIRQNTLLMRGTIRQQLTTASQENMYHWAELSDLGIKLQSGADLELGEQHRLTQTCRALFRGWANYSYQHRIGLLDSSEWAGMTVTIRKNLARPFMLKDLEEIRDEFSEDFVSKVEAIIAGR